VGDIIPESMGGLLRNQHQIRADRPSAASGAVSLADFIMVLLSVS
jgi:hypothetical protein